MQRFPLGFWNYVPVTDPHITVDSVRDWDEAGMTLALSPGYTSEPAQVEKMRAILDECARRDIRVILERSGCNFATLLHQGEEVFRANVAAALREFGEHPAVFGLHCGDEPHKGAADAAFASVRIQQEMAPHWQPFLNLLPWHQNIHPSACDGTWPAYLDRYYAEARPPFFAYDCYYHMNPGEEGWEIYFKNLEHYSAAAVRHGIPFWTTLLSTGHFNYRCPSEEDLRWQLNSALAWGARGILWFFLYQRYPHENFRRAPINEFWERTQTYTDLSYVNRAFLNTTAAALRQLTFKRAYNIGLNWGWGGYPVHREGSRIIAASGPSPLIVSEFAHPDGHEYVAMTNNSPVQNTEATLAVRGASPMLRQVWWQGEERPVGEGYITSSVTGRGSDHIAVTQWLAPGQMALYRVVDEGKAGS